jgi:superfamily II DNA or RNA helicase
MNRFKYKKNLNKKSTSPKNKIFVLDDEYREKVRSESYLGKKGYTIPKSILQKEDEEFLKRDLFVKPVIFGVGGDVGSNAFPVYRENTQKIYLPRFYGIQRYGLPDKSEIGIGDDIQLEFAKPLRDYQEEIIKVYTDYVNSPICVDSEKKGNGGILEVRCGAGKTVMALKIISLLKKKTLIIVHKEFLMNQWIERINEFLPGAKIGKIQGPLLEIEGNDIVIGMIQTLYDKEYSADTFSGFGLTIIDEVHRIGSEQFSKTLFKTITTYMLGISATVERKDQLTKVLYMFIGEKIYSKKEDSDDPVTVRAINYIANDNDFNEVEYDFRGNPKYSTMITKLCEFGPRSDFIIKVINDLIIENNEKQIMILCHNRSLLSYLYNAIKYRGFATVGFYVGGMKQKDLQETEEQQIVLATYAMAAEALDIKTLSTLVMVTPKTDITQSVGRILRAKHENPVIVDIIDTHDLFKKQWLQRKRFYKKCNYRIREIDCHQYKGMKIDWTNNKDWKLVFEPNKKCNSAANEINGINEPSGSEDEKSDNDSKLKYSNNNIGKCLIDVSGFDEI